MFHAVSLFDEVTVRPAQRMSVAVTGEDAATVPTDKTNLAWQAAVALAAAAGRAPRAAAVRIEIRKRIPAAAGLAGGSADAAATLVACNELWKADLSPGALREMARLGLGGDVPFALIGGTAVGRGRGEELTRALAAGTYHWALAFAAGGLSTAQVYATCDRLQAARAPAGARVVGGLGARAQQRADGGASVRRPGRGRPAAEQRPAAGCPVPATGAAPDARGRRPSRLPGALGAIVSRIEPDLRVPGEECVARPRPRGRAGRGRGVPGGRSREAARPRRGRGGAGAAGVNAPHMNLINLEQASKAYHEGGFCWTEVSLGVSARASGSA